jgi:acid phosphatase class B
VFLLFSVKHEYERWNEDKTKLLTCNPHEKVWVSDTQAAQEIEVGAEIVFSYDINFKVLFTNPYFICVSPGTCFVVLGHNLV